MRGSIKSDLVASGHIASYSLTAVAGGVTVRPDHIVQRQ